MRRRRSSTASAGNSTRNGRMLVAASTLRPMTTSVVSSLSRRDYLDGQRRLSASASPQSKHGSRPPGAAQVAFGPMYDLLFEHQDALRPADLVGTPTSSGSTSSGSSTICASTPAPTESP